MTIHRVVFGDDHSTGADIAWGWLNAQEWSGWNLDVVTAVQSDQVVPPPDAVRMHAWSPDTPRHVLPEAHLASVAFLTAVQDPRVLLNSCWDDSLLVIGARGTGRVAEMLFGSTADWLMRSPSGPLVVARDASPTRSVVVAVDGSHHAMAAVRALSSLPWVGQTECQVLSVNNSADDSKVACGEAADLLEGVGAQVQVRVLELDAWQADLNPARRLLEEIDSVHPDLVVMGTMGRTGWPRLWYGSVAGAVAHNFDGNVLLARADTSA